MPCLIICMAVGLLEYAIKIGLLFYLYCLFTGVLITDRFYTDSLITDRLFTDRLFTAESVWRLLCFQEGYGKIPQQLTTVRARTYNMRQTRVLNVSKKVLLRGQSIRANLIF